MTLCFSKDRKMALIQMESLEEAVAALIVSIIVLCYIQLVFHCVFTRTQTVNVIVLVFPPICRRCTIIGSVNKIIFAYRFQSPTFNRTHWHPTRLLLLRFRITGQCCRNARQSMIFMNTTVFCKYFIYNIIVSYFKFNRKQYYIFFFIIIFFFNIIIIILNFFTRLTFKCFYLLISLGVLFSHIAFTCWWFFFFKNSPKCLYTCVLFNLYLLYV
jgi:hypothetical protein